MPLGPIHLIRSEDGEHGASFYCSIPDAIAAIRPDKMPLFPLDVVCAECVRVYRETEANEGTNPPGGQA